MENLRKKAIVALKILISVGLIYFVFTKIDFAEVRQVLKTANPLYLIAALCSFLVSKVLASFRLNIYLHQLNIRLTQKSNMQLYVLGMFYNLFLPGGIGGDAYKGYIIKKQFTIETKKVISVLVIDRLAGLLMLFVYACLMAMMIQNKLLSPYRMLFGIAIVIAFVVFWGLKKKFFSYVLPVFWKSIAFAALTQFVQLITIILILHALSIELNTFAYLFIFLISSILSVISIGGIGSREMAFYYGAILLGLDENTSVVISLIFLAITIFVSLFGIIYLFKKLQLKTTAD